jgi:hypothetical protein
MKCLLVPLLCLLTFGLYGQSGESQEAYVHRHYATQAYHQHLKEQFPHLKNRYARVDLMARSEASKITPTEFTIPIVVHIIHAPQRQPPTRKQVAQQLAILNQDFAREREIHHRADTAKFLNYRDRSTKMELSFCFPRKDTSGAELQEVPIYYHPSDSKVFPVGNHMKFSARGGATAWDPDSFLNIWIVDLARNEAGFAQMPGGPKATDGIVIDFDFFGTTTDNYPYDRGKTLTHLVGSYLGLYELWSEYNRCADDGVEDTPIHNDPNRNASRFRHVSTCDGHPIEMTMNYMDNTVDRKLYMFTLGQKRRIHAMLQENGPRHSLTLNPSLCWSTPQKSQIADIPDRETRPTKPFEVLIYPNPVEDRMTLELRSEQDREVDLVVYDDLGRILFQQQALQIQGFHQIPIATESWSPGLYRLVIKGQDRPYQTTFVKVNR